MSSSRKGVYLVGAMNNQIRTSKLPSKGDVLSVLFYNMRIVNLNLYDSASLVVDEVSVFWKKARIPTQNRSNCITKLKSLYNNLRDLEKSKNRKGKLQKQRERDFVENVNDLFDIASSNALDEIKIQEDRDFLLMQRRKGRPGCMLGVDFKLAQVQKRNEERITAEIRRKESHAIQSSSKQEWQTSMEEDSEIEDCTLEEISDETEEDVSGPSKVKRGRKTLMTPRLAAALDKSKVSDRNAVHILSASLEALSLDINEYILNRSSIKRDREKLREEKYSLVKSTEIDVPFIELHWDSKLLPHMTENKKIDRLPVIAVSLNFEQLLGVPGITSSKGSEVCSAVFDIADDWNLIEKVQAFCFDTTASNTGRLKGAATLLEQKLGRDILWLPCRHHIFEVVLAGVFLETKLIVTSGPEIALFKQFKNEWEVIDKTKYEDYTTDFRTYDCLKDVAAEIKTFATEKVEEEQPRDDYRELLQLILIFLGEKKSNAIFRSPGPYHLARWMAKAIYCLKIFLFRKQIRLGMRNTKLIREICIFLVQVYIKAWFSAPNTVQAPLNDIIFLKKLVDFRKINEDIAQIATKKFINHLWYLNEESAALSIFDDRIEKEEKQRMVTKIMEHKHQPQVKEHIDEGDDDFEIEEEREIQENQKKIILNSDEVSRFICRDIPTELLSTNSLNLFTRLGISTNFFNDDPANWEFLDDYQKGKQIVYALKCVNDTAERGVKLMQDYNDKITKNENQKQFLLQVVSEYRKKYPSATKKDVSK